MLYKFVQVVGTWFVYDVAVRTFADRIASNRVIGKANYFNNDPPVLLISDDVSLCLNNKIYLSSEKQGDKFLITSLYLDHNDHYLREFTRPIINVGLGMCVKFATTRLVVPKLLPVFCVADFIIGTFYDHRSYSKSIKELSTEDLKQAYLNYQHFNVRLHYKPDPSSFSVAGRMLRELKEREIL